MDEMRKQIEELMGSVNYEAAGQANAKRTYQDPDVCKYYITGLCPHDLFQNTRLFMGECAHQHDEEMKEGYLKDRANPDFESLCYEEQAHRYMWPIIEDCDKKISKQTQERCNEGSMHEAFQEGTKKKIADIEEKTNKLVSKVEQLGHKGNVEESMKCMEEVHKLNEQKSKHKEAASRQQTEVPGGWQKLKPCAICGALLSSKDDESRRNEHFSGRIHIGYDLIRKHIQKLEEIIEERKTKIEAARAISKKPSPKDEAEGNPGGKDANEKEDTTKQQEEDGDRKRVARRRTPSPDDDRDSRGGVTRDSYRSRGADGRDGRDFRPDSYRSSRGDGPRSRESQPWYREIRDRDRERDYYRENNRDGRSRGSDRDLNVDRDSDRHRRDTDNSRYRSRDADRDRRDKDRDRDSYSRDRGKRDKDRVRREKKRERQRSRSRSSSKSKSPSSSPPKKSRQTRSPSTSKSPPRKRARSKSEGSRSRSHS
eukprot:Selendium_serpulae@DN5151_c0_g1_i4.p1